MSDSTGTPGYSNSSKLKSYSKESSSIADDSSTDPKTASSPPPKDGNSSTPGAGNSPSPPGVSHDDDNSSAPPPSSNSAPPSPPTSYSKSSPPPSNSPPPASNSQPPKASPSPPPASPPPQKKSSSPPPPPPPASTSPPPDSDKQSPPPSETPSAGGKVSPSPPPPAAARSPPSPQASTGSGSSPPSHSASPPPQLSPPVAQSTPGTPPVTSSPNPPPSTVVSPPTASSGKAHPPPPTSKSVPSMSPPTDSSKSSTGKTNPPAGSPSNGSQGYVVGATVAAGVFIVALVAIFFVLRRRKKRSEVFAPPYMPPNSFTINSDGYNYYGEQQSKAHSGPMDPYYGLQPPHSSLGNNYESQRGNMYHGGGQDSGGIGGKKSIFSYEELMEITNGFSHQNVIGQGGFGCVYKGWLPDGKLAAVKQLKAGSGQGEREFRAEVDIISRVHHKHLVSLVGYCISEQQRLLIYEFVPNGTLEHHLHDKGLPVLDWIKRTKIALGAAKGLAYLHEDCQPKIIHRDIKSANILLDDAFEAQVADFGLAKLNNDTNTHVSTRVMGTFGYMAPEYASSGKLTDRSDVFSFGVVLLELITGRKPVDSTQPLGDESLVEWARPLLIHALETGDFSDLVDQRLEKHYVESEMIRMIEAAAACVRHSAPKRPRMMQVARSLESDDQLSDLSNGVKYGQSTVYDSGQYSQDIRNFRRTALGGEDSSEFDANSGEYNSREVSNRPKNSWTSRDSSSEFASSCESETQAIKGNYTGRRF